MAENTQKKFHAVTEQFSSGPLGQFKKDWSVQKLNERFAKEEQLAA